MKYNIFPFISLQYKIKYVIYNTYKTQPMLNLELRRKERGEWRGERIFNVPQIFYEQWDD